MSYSESDNPMDQQLPPNPIGDLRIQVDKLTRDMRELKLGQSSLIDGLDRLEKHIIRIDALKTGKAEVHFL